MRAVVFVPPPFAKEAILEAENAQIPLIVCITEGIPVRDMLEVAHVMKKSRTSRLIGPNCPGIITPASAKSASCLAISIKRDRSALCPDPAPSLMRPSGKRPI